MAEKKKLIAGISGPALENAHIHIQIRRKHVWQTLKTINKNNVTFEKALFTVGLISK